MLIATEIIGNVGVGVTSPQFFRANDEKIYVVKLQNNRLGAKVLVNEFIAAKFGELMDLRFPNSDFIEINAQFLERQCLNRSNIIPGRHFASQFLEHVEYVSKHNLYKAINTKEMAGIMLFDHIFHNADRANNRRNLLIRPEDTGYKIYAIDNSHLFRSGRWTLASLDHLSTKIKPYYRYSFGLLLKDCLTPQDFLPYLEKVSIITNDIVEKIVREIPIEWLPSELERKVLVDFINLRCSMAVEIWDTLCKYIPREHGGHRWLFGRRINNANFP